MLFDFKFWFIWFIVGLVLLEEIYVFLQGEVKAGEVFGFFVEYTSLECPDIHLAIR
jgi:hypothetical protein